MQVQYFALQLGIEIPNFDASYDFTVRHSSSAAAAADIVDSRNDVAPTSGVGGDDEDDAANWNTPEADVCRVSMQSADSIEESSNFGSIKVDDRGVGDALGDIAVKSAAHFVASDPESLDIVASKMPSAVEYFIYDTVTENSNAMCFLRDDVARNNNDSDDSGVSRDDPLDESNIAACSLSAPGVLDQTLMCLQEATDLPSKLRTFLEESRRKVAMFSDTTAAKHHGRGGFDKLILGISNKRSVSEYLDECCSSGDELNDVSLSSLRSRHERFWESQGLD